MQRCEATGLSYSLPCWWLLYGPPGGGKSSLAARMVGARSRPSAIYSAEEGAHQALADRLRRAGLARRSDVEVLFDASAAQLVEHARAGHVIVIDSIQATALQWNDVAGLLRAGAPEVFSVLQATKSGQARGDLTWLHAADVVLAVADGAWTTGKNRFGPTGLIGPAFHVPAEEASA